MKSMFSVKAIPMLAAAVLAPLVSLAQTGGEQKALTGVVSDAMCGQTHMMKDKPAAECLRYCVKQGTKYALVAGKNIYTLEGHETELDKYAAQKVTVKGTLTATNHKSTGAKMRISVGFSGELTAADGNPKVTKGTKGLGELNPNTFLEWRPEVKSW